MKVLRSIFYLYLFFYSKPHGNPILSHESFNYMRLDLCNSQKNNLTEEKKSGARKKKETASI